MPRTSLWLAIGALGLGTCLAQAITLNQVDDFEDGTTMNWSGQVTFTNKSTGGPSGAGDNYLELDSSFRLGTRNPSQWVGDYVSAGVTAITMDLNNTGTNTVDLRLMLVDNGGNTGGNFSTTNAVTLAGGSGWQEFTFSLTPIDMTHVGAGTGMTGSSGGSGILSDTLAAVDRLLLRHDPGGPSPPGTAPSITATIGIDNITAVPEPASLVMATVGFLLVARRRRSAEDGFATAR